MPVTIVGGYLGSGKTTLINHLLTSANGCKYAVLVNDFGELAIDAQLIEAKEGNVISLSGGCVCCSYGNDLVGALMELDVSAIDQVIIEASGVALPGAIAGSLSLLQGYVVSSVVVLVDGCNIETHAADKYLADTIQRQLESADMIVVNKSDLIDSDQQAGIVEWLGRDYTSSGLICVSHADCPPELFRTDTSQNFPEDVIDSERLTDANLTHQTSLYTTFVLDLPGEYNVENLLNSLTERSLGILRAKGFVSDDGGGMKTVQIVGTRSTVQSAPTGVTAGLVCIGLSGQCSEELVRTAVGSQ